MRKYLRAFAEDVCPHPGSEGDVYPQARVDYAHAALEGYHGTTRRPIGAFLPQTPSHKSQVVFDLVFVHADGGCHFSSFAANVDPFLAFHPDRRSLNSLRPNRRHRGM